MDKNINFESITLNGNIYYKIPLINEDYDMGVIYAYLKGSELLHIKPKRWS